MARPKKSDQKAAPPTPVAAAVAPPALLPQAPAPALPQVLPDNSVATLVINKADYARLRDSVHSRLSTIQELLRDFAADYLRQSNLLLGEPTSLDALPSLGALARLDGAALGFAPQLDLAPAAEEKKERKKRQHDPNAPKRPLTPYFLYMQTARPIIATDLGQDAPKGAVQEEGQRRWAAMSPNEKNAWNNAYQFNLRLYNARVHSYKAGNLAARDMSDQDALTYADANQVAQPNLTIDDSAAAGVNDQDAIVEQLQNSVPVAAVVPEEAKTPKPKATRKRKSTAADGLEEGETSAVKTAAATPVSPEKKRKRQSKAAEPASEEPKKSGRKKKNA